MQTDAFLSFFREDPTQATHSVSQARRNALCRAALRYHWF
ncbi:MULTISPECIES: hypothetical protein [unclassified Gilvibacter]